MEIRSLQSRIDCNLSLKQQVQIFQTILYLDSLPLTVISKWECKEEIKEDIWILAYLYLQYRCSFCYSLYWLLVDWIWCVRLCINRIYSSFSRNISQDKRISLLEQTHGHLTLFLPVGSNKSIKENYKKTCHRQMQSKNDFFFFFPWRKLASNPMLEGEICLEECWCIFLQKSWRWIQIQTSRYNFLPQLNFGPWYL